MNSQRSLTVGLAVLTVLTLAQAQNRHRPKRSPCPEDKTYTGKYRNRLHGFSMVIPAGLQGYWNSAGCPPHKKYGCACVTDHGRIIPLANDAVIESFAGNETLPRKALANYEKSSMALLEYESDGHKLTVQSSKKFRLDRLNGRRFVVEFSRNGKRLVSDRIVAVYKGVTYSLTLSTTASRFTEDEATFEKVIASWKLTKRVR